MDKKNQSRIEHLTEALAAVKIERDNARQDVEDIRRFMWAIIRLDGIDHEDMAVGLVLCASIVSAWPNSYSPDVPTLAACARVDTAAVFLVLDSFRQAGLLYPGEEN